MKQLGLYLHIPFCRSKCLYCDFCSYPRPQKELTECYVSAMCRELEQRADDCADFEVDTVYFGGGTPTVLEVSLLEKLTDTLFRCYRVSKTAEITSECNPATGGGSYFRAMRQMGFNRLSFGVQSVHPAELRALGRIHSFEDACRSFEDAREAGFENLSADLMFGIPHQTKESFAESLEKLCGLHPKHLSVYSLIVEEGTPFGKRGADRLDLPDDDTVSDMYADMVAYLHKNGVEQYEISNFAVKGYESRHNLKYWNTDPYLGFGVAAYSDFEGRRFGNSRDIQAYCRGESILAEEETASEEVRLNEYVMLRMRLAKGISLKELENRFGTEARERFDRALGGYVKGGFVKKTDEGYAFSVKGMLVSNAILSDILDF